MVPPKRILIIDDEEDLNRLMKMALESSGDFEVHFESRAHHAVETAKEFKPDLMILDLIMPGMDGGELVLQIKQDPNLREVPIIFLTASITTGSVDSGSSLFGYPCLNKPASVDEVVELIGQCLDGQSN